MPLGSRSLLLDAALATALTGLSLAALVAHATRPLPAVAYLLVVAGTAPLALRQIAPVATTTVVLADAAVYMMQGYGGNLPNNGVAILLGVFTVATLRSWRAAAPTFVAAVAVLALASTTMTGARWPDLAQSVLALGGAWALGEGTRRWSRRAEGLAAQAAVAVTAERVRIARELHDVVAHHMAVISLQAGLAEYVLDADPATAKQAITTVGDSSRHALAEMRRLLVVLRAEDQVGLGDRSDEGPLYAPQPGLAAVEELAGRVRAAGLPVTVQTHGRVRDLPAGPDLTAYRVVQESLTNVVKHAGPASARVGLDFGRDTLTISVADDGVGAGAASPAPDSNGLRGMRERVELFGGAFHAETSPTGGFAVLARLPIPEP